VFYQSSLLFHCRAIQRLLPNFQAQATMGFGDFSLELRARNRYFHLQPQFTHREQGRLRYFPRMRDDTLGFVGWLPYFNKRWPAGSEKLPFKELCVANGLRTPAFSTVSAGALGDVLVKHRFSSFGSGMRGPYRRADQGTPQSRLGENEYYEEFVPGRIAKVWYWDERPVCLELFDMPAVTGDGARSFAELVATQVQFPGVPPERSHLEALARYQGFRPDDVTPAGARLLADFRYSSPLFQLRGNHNGNVLPQHEKGEIGRQLREAGRVFWKDIPEAVRRGTLYTVDAIVDGKERVWFLEMNCNPMIHPDVYLAMFEGLFGPAEAVAAPAIMRPVPSGTVGLSTVPLSPPAAQLASMFAIDAKTRGAAGDAASGSLVPHPSP
jgi:hypothetical protein